MAKKAVKKSAPGAQSQPDTTQDFESSLAELEDLVEQMEAGDITLEESLKHFERGITLTRMCQQALKQAEQKVQILIKDNDEPESFSATRNDEAGDDESASA